MTAPDPEGSRTIDHLGRVCVDLERFIGMVPTFLPVAGEATPRPPFRDYERRSAVGKALGEVSRSIEALVAHPGGHPEEDLSGIGWAALLNLQAAVLRIRARWDAEDVAWGEARDRLYAEADELERQHGYARVREIPPPERRIERAWLTWLEQARALLRNEVLRLDPSAAGGRPVPRVAELTECQRDIIKLISKKSQRMVTSAISQELEHGESTIKLALAALVKADPPLLDNCRHKRPKCQCDPRGYGLPAWGHS
jgi:hypothetical protein